MPNEYSDVVTLCGLLDRITTWPLSPLKLKFSRSNFARLDSMCLKPCLKECCLPKPRMPFRAHLRLRLRKHVVHELLAKKISLLCSGLRENVSDEIKKGSAQIAQCRHREIPFRPVYDLSWKKFSRGFLQHVLPACAYLQPGRNARSKL